MRLAVRLAIVALSVASPLLRAAEPTTRPAMTQRDLIQPFVAFATRTIVDAYAKQGHRDPRWDADAMRLLPAEVQDTVVHSTEPPYRPAETMSSTDRAVLARRIVASGCDDAAVLYEAMLSMHDVGDAPATADVAARAAAAAPTSPYALVLQLQIAIADAVSRHGEHLPLDPSPRLTALARTVLADRSLAPSDRREVWGVCGSLFQSRNDKLLLTLGDAIESMTDADPWLFHTLMGRVEIARGHAASNASTAWRQHAAAAREHFRQAIEADDSLPAPFAYLIAIGAVDGSHTAHAWLDQALARQSDYAPAFDEDVWSLSPRYGGSHEQMLQVGIDAVDGGRFDTSVPAVLFRAIRLIEADAKPAALSQAELAAFYPQIVRCLDGYLAYNGTPASHRWARSTRAAWAARLGKWDEANAQFAALAAAGDTVDPDAFETIHVDLADAQRRAAATTRP